MAAALADASGKKQVLRYVGRIDANGKATVGLVRLDAKHAFANIALTDNVVRFATRRYCDNPLIVQGPGAGPEVTAGGVFSDLLRLSAYLGAHLATLMLTDVTAFAPATVANVGIGFDISGTRSRRWAIACACKRIEEPVVRIRSIRASPAICRSSPKHNTAGRAVQAMHARRSSSDFGFEWTSTRAFRWAPAWAARRPPRWRRWSRPTRCCSDAGAAPAAAQVRHGGRDRRERLGAHRQHRAVPVRRLVLTVGIDHPRVKQIPVPPRCAACWCIRTCIWGRARRAPC
jgi:hypothetical protein